MLFEGPVVERDWKDEGGYMTGSASIEGRGDYEGQTLKFWHRNENHVTWLDGEPYVTSPDLIMTIDSNTGEPYTNADIDKGSELTIIGRAANPLFESPEGISTGGPGHYGFDLEHRPYAEVVASPA